MKALRPELMHQLRVRDEAVVNNAASLLVHVCHMAVPRH